MAKRKRSIPEYGTCVRGGITYYRTRIKDTDGKRVSLYAHTPEELYDKVHAAREEIAGIMQNLGSPTVAEYCEKWKLMQKGRIRDSTMTDYEWKIRKYIVGPLGDMHIADVTPDDVKMAILPVLTQSASVYETTRMLFMQIFESAVDSRIIDESPCLKLPAKGGKPPKEKNALSDEQVKKLLAAIEGLPPYTFVLLGLYCGLRREEILGLQWDCVSLDEPGPYVCVRRSWHADHNRPVILEELKTKASRRNVPIPEPVAHYLLQERVKSHSQFVIANKDGNPLSYSQFKRMWEYITTRSTQVRTYTRYVNGQKIKHTVRPKVGEKALHNKDVVYSLDFHVTPHQLRHTYITNLIYAGVDPKTVQYLAGHENSKITMDIYAKVKYNRPEVLSSIVNQAFASFFSDEKQN